MSSVRYHSLGPLLSGEGSRAFLGLALQEGLAPRPVVLVWAPPEVARDSELSGQLQRETQRASALEHPNILRVHGLAQLEPGLARITEFANGESLRRVLEVRPRIPPAFAALIVSDVAMGLHYAHLAGNDDGTPLVHGDLRPETVMVSFSGVCKVSGYGALNVAPRERNGRRVRNRRNYSAPEQLTGGRGAMTPGTDVFLLGLLLHECLSGRMPFQGAADGDQAVLTEALPPLPNDVPRSLSAVVMRATAKRVNDRYPTALDFRNAVVHAVEGVIPPAAIFSEFLAQLFPPDRDARATRHQLLEMGLAEIERRGPNNANGGVITLSRVPSGSMPRISTADLTDKVDTLNLDIVEVPFENDDADAVDTVLEITGRHARPGVARPMPREEPEAVSPSPAPADPVAAAPAVPPAEASNEAAAPRSRGSRLSLILASVMATAAAAMGGFFLWSGPPSAPSTPAAPPAATAPAPKSPASATPPRAVTQAPPPAVPETGTPTSPAAGTPAEAAPAVAQATPPPSPPDAVVPATGSTPSAPDAKAPDVKSPAASPDKEITTRLQLFVLPPVEVSLEGQSLGKTPLSVLLAPGPHTLELSNPAKGVRTLRTLTVNPQGVTIQRFLLGRGTVQVSAPSGAAILLDGHKAGRKLTLWEGEHQLVVTSQSGRWEKSFQLESGQRLTFDATPGAP